MWLSGQSLLGRRRIGRVSNVSQIAGLVWGILVSGVVRGLLGCVKKGSEKLGFRGVVRCHRRCISGRCGCFENSKHEKGAGRFEWRVGSER